MELREYWRALRRRAWIPVVLVVVAVVTTTAVGLISKPEYTATATVIARGTNPALTFPEVATANTVAITVITQLGLNQSVEQVTSRIHTTGGHGNVYRISINDSDPS